MVENSGIELATFTLQGDSLPAELIPQSKTDFLFGYPEIRKKLKVEFPPAGAADCRSFYIDSEPPTGELARASRDCTPN